MEAVHHLGTKIVFGSFLTWQLKLQSQLQITKHTHTHTHTRTHTYTHSADWSQTELKPSCAGVPSPFNDPIHNSQRSKLKLFPTRPCWLTLLQSVTADFFSDLQQGAFENFFVKKWQDNMVLITRWQPGQDVNVTTTGGLKYSKCVFHFVACCYNFRGKIRLYIRERGKK